MLHNIMGREEDIKAVRQLKEEKGLTFSEIGRELGFSERTARRRYIKKERTIPRVPNVPFSYDQYKPVEITGDCLITCDWHIPLHSELIVDKLIKTAVDNKIKKLAIVGDYWHMDSFGYFAPYQSEANLEIEREHGQAIGEILADTFDEISFSHGNHDYRLLRKTDFTFSFEYGMKWMFADLPKKKLAKYTFTNLDYMVYRWKNKVMRLCHPKNFSKIPLKVARELAQKYQTSILTAHSHHCAQGVALDGENLIFDGGGLFDANKTEYIQKTTTHHVWVPGFLMWKNNTPNLLSPAFENL